MHLPPRLIISSRQNAFSLMILSAQRPIRLTLRNGTTQMVVIPDKYPNPLAHPFHPLKNQPLGGSVERTSETPAMRQKSPANDHMLLKAMMNRITSKNHALMANNSSTAMRKQIGTPNMPADVPNRIMRRLYLVTMCISTANRMNNTPKAKNSGTKSWKISMMLRNYPPYPVARNVTAQRRDLHSALMTKRMHHTRSRLDIGNVGPCRNVQVRVF